MAVSLSIVLTLTSPELTPGFSSLPLSAINDLVEYGELGNEPPIQGQGGDGLNTETKWSIN